MASRRRQQKPSFKHLFAFVAPRHYGILVVGLVASMLLGGLKTGLSILIGKIFGVISDFGSEKLTGPETSAQVFFYCGILAILGGAALFVNFAFVFFWSLFSELHARSVRQIIFRALLKKDMVWFDHREDGVASMLVGIQTYFYSSFNSSAPTFDIHR